MRAGKHARRLRYPGVAMEKRKTGPRGGNTTVTAGGLLKKTIYLDAEEWEALRQKSFDEDRPISEIVREVIRHALGLDEG